METPDDNLDRHQLQQRGGRVWIAIILTILVATSGYALFRLSREGQQQAGLVVRTNQALQASLDQAKSDLNAAVDKLNAEDARIQAAQLSAAAAKSEPAPEQAAENPALGKPIHKTKASGARSANAKRAAVDPRWSEMDAKLADQQKQLESTKSDIAKTREDLEGSLGSTRDELNGAIAKTHDEVAELRKRGERNYYEFDLDKSAAFERTGPVSLSLRKANVKRKYFDIALIVDDQRIEKKHVNLYEPLWVSVPDRPQPVQVVVNSITKDHVKGYLSEPKFKKSELASNASAPATVTGSNMPNPSTSQPAPAATDKGFSKSLQ